MMRGWGTTGQTLETLITVQSNITDAINVQYKVTSLPHKILIAPLTVSVLVGPARKRKEKIKNKKNKGLAASAAGWGIALEFSRGKCHFVL